MVTPLVPDGAPETLAVGAVSSMPVIWAEPTNRSAKLVLVTLKQRYLVLSDSLVTVTVTEFAREGDSGAS